MKQSVWSSTFQLVEIKFCYLLIEIDNFVTSVLLNREGIGGFHARKGPIIGALMQ